MIISAIVAMGKNREIGLNNQLLWKLSDDLKLFKKTTLGHIIIMGRKTYESIGRPLPGRITFVLSTTLTPGELGENVEIFSNLESAFNEAKKRKEEEVFVCGGGQIYQLALPLLDRLYLSEVDFSGEADAFFPEFQRHDWIVNEKIEFEKSEKNQFDFQFLQMGRTANRT